ncbi:MAG: 3-mercaptopyruvate sulfurtransferase [Acetobacteraceae bacterium]
MPPLVSTEWLAKALGEPDLVVFDATMYLPHEGRDGHAEYLQGHIPGARFFDIDKIADAPSDLPHMLPTPGRFSRLIGVLGVGNRNRVVFYDQKGLASAARGWWMMGVFGHDQAAVLDGGLPKWRAEKRPLEEGEPPRRAPALFRPDYRARRVRGIGDLLANLDSRSELVLDARSASRFNGTAPEPRAGVRGGHIPGAANLAYGELLNPDATFRPADALRARFAAAGADGSRPVVTSCGSGVSATILTLGLTLAGLPPGAVYDGSWTEWGSRSDTPIER